MGNVDRLTGGRTILPLRAAMARATLRVEEKERGQWRQKRLSTGSSIGVKLPLEGLTAKADGV